MAYIYKEVSPVYACTQRGKIKLELDVNFYLEILNTFNNARFMSTLSRIKMIRGKKCAAGFNASAKAKLCMIWVLCKWTIGTDCNAIL